MEDERGTRTEEMVEVVNHNLMELNMKEPQQTSQKDDDDTSESSLSFGSPESPGSPESSDSYASPKPPKKKIQRGIKYRGGYGPPPRPTRKIIDPISSKKCNELAALGLELLNKRMSSNGVHYELVMAHMYTIFRTKEGPRYHANFVAKISDDPNAEKTLFLALYKLGPIEASAYFYRNMTYKYEAIDCYDLGPIHTDTERCRSCEICKKREVSCTNFHPVRSDIDHSCDLCDLYGPIIPVFHPPGPIIPEFVI